MVPLALHGMLLSVQWLAVEYGGKEVPVMGAPRASVQKSQDRWLREGAAAIKAGTVGP